MSKLPHPDLSKIKINCAVITVSDIRTIETDKSGQVIQQLLSNANHIVKEYEILPDDPGLI